MSYNFADGFYRVRIKKGYKTQKQFINSFNDYFNLKENEEHYLKTDTVSNWERGKTMPRGETLIKLCDFLNCDMDYLFGGTEFINKDVQHIHEYTGLTESAIDRLHAFCLGKQNPSNIEDLENNQLTLKIISGLLSHKDFIDVIGVMVTSYKEHDNDEWYIFYANRGIQQIINSLISNEIDIN